MFYNTVSQIYFARGPFWFRKKSKDPHILAHIIMLYPYDRYLKLKTLVYTYISELLLGNYK